MGLYFRSSQLCLIKRIRDFNVLACVFITAGPITKLFAGGGGGEWRTCAKLERRRGEACVDESAHHALANAGGREIVGKKEGEQKGSARGSVH